MCRDVKSNNFITMFLFLYPVKIFMYLETLFQIYPLTLSIFVIMLLIGSTNQVGFSQTDNPRFTGPIDKNISITDLDKDWWDVVLETPSGNKHPSEDLDGSACSAGDLHEKVWFLFGTFGGIANRECEIPSGKIIYFAHGYECNSIENPQENTDEKLKKCAAIGANKEIIPGKYKVKFDGKEINDLFDYKVISPPFNITLPENAVFKLPPGNASAAAVTYYIFFKPLDPGIHTLEASTSSIPDPLNPGKQVNSWNVNYKMVAK